MGRDNQGRDVIIRRRDVIIRGRDVIIGSCRTAVGGLKLRTRQGRERNDTATSESFEDVTGT